MIDESVVAFKEKQFIYEEWRMEKEMEPRLKCDKFIDSRDLRG